VIRKARLVSGLILLVFVTSHLINAMFGLISVNAMDAAAKILLGPWLNPVGQILLYGSMLVHVVLAFVALYRRRSLRMPASEGVQLVMGLAIPAMLAIHVIGTRGAEVALDMELSYRWILFIYWITNPEYGVLQAATLLVVWIHGCAGIYLWLRLKPVWVKLRGTCFVVGLLLPVLALLGFAEGGKEVLRMASEPGWVDQTLANARVPSEEAIGQLLVIRDLFVGGYLALLLVVLGLRVARSVWEKRHGVVRLHYGSGVSATFPHGMTILEASEANGIPHASVCGGRGRCSTCRVRITEGLDVLPPASEDETKVLNRVKAAPDVRLACQTTPPGGEYHITTLLPPTASARDGHSKPDYLKGQEMEIAILFADLRGFTQVSEKKLPYDVVFLLNRYFDSMGRAVEQAGGRLDKFIGDGVMALFGIGRDANTGCRQAVAAAQAMSDNLRDLNESLRNDLDAPLRIGIGIHVGPTIVGEMGYAQATQVTAVGDTVNTASRLETMTKEFGAQLVLSETVARMAGVETDGLDSREIEIRGRDEPMQVLIAESASSLAMEEKVSADA